MSELAKNIAKNSMKGRSMGGNPWKNGYNESLNGKFRDELLNGEIFYTFKEAKVLIGKLRLEYNTFRPHSFLNYRLSAP
jgi:transposase InsO family protein